MALLHSHLEGKYEILEKIKEGGMGAVYKVRHRFLDEIRVVKVIRASLEPTTELSDRFLREARVAIRLRHPNIAALHDFSIAEGGHAYIVMEHIAGLTLEDVLRAHGPPPIGLTLEIAQQSLKAIGYLHRRGFVHRDVAPDNLMLTRGVDGEPLVKLIDLGIAKVLASEGDFTSTGMFLGKPRYASPEHFGAEGGLDGRSDLYSFGIVLYELATGHAPVVGRDPASFMAGHLLRPPRDFAETDPAGRVPSDLRALLLLALAKRAAERIASAEEFARGLAPIGARFPVLEGDLDRALQPPLPDAAAPWFPPDANDGSTQNRLDRQFGNVTTPPPEARGTALETVGATARLDAETAATLSLPGVAGEGSPAALARGEPAAPAADWRSHLLQPATPSSRGPASARPAPVHDVRWQKSAPAGGAAGAARGDEDRGGWTKPLLGILLLLGALGTGIWWYLHPAVPLGASAGASERGPAVPRTAPEEASSARPAASPVAAASPAGASPSGAANPNPAAAGPPAAARPTGDTARGSVSHSAAGRAARAALVPGAPGSAPALPPLPAAPEASAADVRRGARAGAAASAGAPPEREAELSGLITPGPGVEVAEPTSIPDAIYPAAAKGTGMQPRVLVAVLVDEKGNVAEARVKAGDSSGLGFNEAALAAVQRARFLPATRNGVAGRSWSELMIEFTAPPSGQ